MFHLVGWKLMSFRVAQQEHVSPRFAVAPCRVPERTNDETSIKSEQKIIHHFRVFMDFSGCFICVV